jgi:hypothetical protein
MLKTREKIIDGNTFAVTQLPAMRALRLFSRIGRSLGPALGQLAAAAGKGAGSMKLDEFDMSTVGEAIAVLFDRLTPDELETLTKELLESARIDGRELMREFDIAMQGRVGTVFKLLMFSFEVNYGDFFGAARGLVAQAKPAGSNSAGSTI